MAGIVRRAKGGASHWRTAPAASDDGTRVLGEALATLAGDPERRGALASRAREGAARFDVMQRIHEVVALYRELVSPG